VKAEARVLEVNGERARLACDSAAAVCPACAGRGSCALQRFAGGRESRLEISTHAVDGVVLAPGSRVWVKVDDGALVGSAARACLPPLAGLLAVPLLVHTVAAGSGEGVLLLGAVVGLLLGWAAARVWLGRSPPQFAVGMAEEPGHDG
jgi:positive regulator of sigma E activity